MADVDSAQEKQSISRYRGSIHTGTPSEGGRSSLMTGSVGPPAILFASPVIKIDDTSVLHPVFPTKIRRGIHSINDGRRKDVSSSIRTFNGDNR